MKSKNRPIRPTIGNKLLIIKKISVGGLPKIVLLWYYHSTTENFLGSILAIAVKPFGCSRKVFRLQPYGCKVPCYSLFIGLFTPLQSLSIPIKPYQNNTKKASLEKFS